MCGGKATHTAALAVFLSRCPPSPLSSLPPFPAGELLAAAEPFLARNMHPTVIIRGYTLALEAALAAVRGAAFGVDPADRDGMLSVLTSCLGTKFSSRFGPLIAELALDAVRTVAVPGGDLTDSRVLAGVMFAKDVVAPGRMARTLRRPRVLLLDCPLEYKKGESQTNVEVTKEEDWAALLAAEEDAVARMCADVAAAKPDLVVTEKGISDLAVHCLSKAGIAAIRRVRKTDNNRIARATGATIVHR